MDKGYAIAIVLSAAFGFTVGGLINNDISRINSRYVCAEAFYGNKIELKSCSDIRFSKNDWEKVSDDKG